MSIVCEPRREKCAPATESHGRVSLQLHAGRSAGAGRAGARRVLGRGRRDPEILELAQRIHYWSNRVPAARPVQGGGASHLKDGRTFDEVEEYNRGLGREPDDVLELRRKFSDNASAFLTAVERERLADEIGQVERLPDASVLVGFTIP